MKITHYECDICKKRMEEPFPGFYRQSINIQQESFVGKKLNLEISTTVKAVDGTSVINMDVCKKCLTDILSKDL